MDHATLNLVANMLRMRSHTIIDPLHKQSVAYVPKRWILVSISVYTTLVFAHKYAEYLDRRTGMHQLVCYYIKHGNMYS